MRGQAEWCSGAGREPSATVVKSEYMYATAVSRATKSAGTERGVSLCNLTTSSECDGSGATVQVGHALIFRKPLGLESKMCCPLFILDPRINSATCDPLTNSIMNADPFWFALKSGSPTPLHNPLGGRVPEHCPMRILQARGVDTIPHLVFQRANVLSGFHTHYKSRGTTRGEIQAWYQTVYF